MRWPCTFPTFLLNNQRTTVKEADEDESVSEVESSGDEFADAEADGGESESSANESDADGSEEEDSASASEASSEDERRSAKRPRKTARAVIEPLVYDSPKTPTSRKPTRKLMSASAKAARSLTLEARGTPRSAPTTPFEKARQSLHVAAVPKALPCREKEFEDIESYIEDAILDGSGSCVCWSIVCRGWVTGTETNETTPR